MARTEGRIFTSIWSDGDFRKLSHGAQWLYVALVTQPDLSPCGVLPDIPSRWARLTSDVSARQAAKWRDELVQARFVMVDPDTGELLVRSLVRRDGGLDSPNLTVAIARAFGAVHSVFLRERIVEEFQKAFPKGVREGLRERLDEGKAKPPPKPIWERLPEDFRDAVTCASPLHPFT